MCRHIFPTTLSHYNNIYMNLSDVNIPPVLFVTGTGTDVGKSFATGWLAREIMESGRSCITQKMIQTQAICL